MLAHKPQPAESSENLRGRVGRFFKESVKKSISDEQLLLDLPVNIASNSSIDNATQSVSSFLDFVSDSMPDGDVYIFGGILRDLALFGKKGFNSDIDLVVEGDWTNLVPYLLFLKAKKNKFV